MGHRPVPENEHGDKAHKPSADSHHHARLHHEAHQALGAHHPASHDKSPAVTKKALDFSHPAAHLQGIDGNKPHVVKTLDADKPHFDAKKSVHQIVTEGIFKRANDHSHEADYKHVESGHAPKVTVVFEDKNHAHKHDPHTPKPNYIVHKDGSIAVVHNPEGTKYDANVVIQVARDDKQTEPPSKVQQKAIDDLVQYQCDRIKDKFDHNLKEVGIQGSKVKQVEISDSQHLVSDHVEQKFGNRLVSDGMTPPHQVPADAKQASDLMNRVHGSGGHARIPRESAPGRHAGDSSPAGVDQIIPPREVPQAPKESNSIASMKDAAASLFNPDRSHPYDTVRANPDHSYRVGRYGLNQGDMLMGLAEMLGADFGNPPDYNRLMNYIHNNPQAVERAIQRRADQMTADADRAHLSHDDKVRKTADDLRHFAKSLDDSTFRQGFESFLSDMKGNGAAVTSSRLAHFMPKELQEVMAENAIDYSAKRLGADPNHLSADAAGKISLALLLGHAPNSQEQSNPEYNDFVKAGSNMYKLAESRLQSLGDIDISDVRGKIMAAASHDVGRAMWQKYLDGGRLGCAASVSAVLNEAGFSYANSVGVSALQDQLVAHGWTVSSTPHAGDVVCGYRKPKGSGKSGQAHTGIVGNDGTWDNHSRAQVWSHDPLSAWNAREYPAGVVFLRPPGNA